MLVGAARNVIEGNLIGTDASGTAALGNQSSGIWIAGPENAVGGTSPAARNVISGNMRNGIEFRSTAAVKNLVQGNYIGVDVTGTVALGNGRAGPGWAGVALQGGSDNMIGGSAPGAGNVISGSPSAGITWAFCVPAVGDVVQGNYIGTDRTGTVAIPNGPGLVVQPDCNGITIGGTDLGAGNLISGNRGRGIVIDRTEQTVVQGNLIGTDVTGTRDLGNGSTGVYIGANASPGNLVGGSASRAGNVISGNDGGGITIGLFGPSTLHSPENVIQGNSIGVDIAGEPLGNRGNGVLLLFGANGTTVGGPTAREANTIAYNTGSGVGVADGTGNAILSNAIFDNGVLGVNLGRAGVTANDTGDPDEGANELQNYPTITSARSTGTRTIITGTLSSAPGRKPGSSENPIKLNDRGPPQIPVALLATSEFDAGDAEPASLTLGDETGADTPLSQRRNGTWMAEEEDVDGDGNLDVILHFDRAALIANGDITAATAQLCLNGRTRAGVPIRGCDVVRPIP